ncbi:hypothetical protein [Azospirillum himalayense]|uniref:Uncharacterized protein n=1 Tax=Azospirillum himalayense TaxID=654847 RepID=A0ABW0FXS3_9PROT
MTWILIGYLAWSGYYAGGGPFTAEFATKEACLSAAAIIEKDPKFGTDGMRARHAVCVPKGTPQ